ncbi:MAG: lytic transglycosylase domain-containing protein [Gemmatimonadota bacterium]
MSEQELQAVRQQGRRGRDTLRDLIRKPTTQLILVVTAAAQLVNVQIDGVADEGAAFQTTPKAVATVELEPALVTPDSTLQRAWMRRAVEREAARLGSDYRIQGYDVPPQLAQQIGEAAAEFGIDTNTAFGLVRAESSFRNVATSRVGAIGLTQLMPRTAAWMEPGITRSQLRDPQTNLRIGFKYFRYLMDKYEGDERLALLAYNRGPGTVDKALKRGGNPDNGYADFVFGKSNHGHKLFTR